MEWEYKMTSIEDEHELNKLGQKGWELAGVSTYHLILKRPIKEEKPTKEESDIDAQKLEVSKAQVPHPKMYYRLLRDELPLMKEGQYIVTERVQVETLQEFRNKAASLEESKLFLPLLDSEIERLLNLERLHLSRIAGFVVPKEIRFLERH